MNKSLLVFASALLVADASVYAQSDASTGVYQVGQTLQVGGTGGWDYLTVDSAQQLLFIPRSTHTLVLDAKSGKTVADIPGQKRNHGVAIVPAAGRGFITDGGEGDVVIFDLKSYEVLGKIKAEDDADGIIYDASSNKVLLVSGDGGVLIPISPDVDPKAGKADAEIDLGGSPEFLAADGRGHAFVNVMNKDNVAVVDLKTMKVTDHWSVAPGGSPVGMAIDREHHRLFIGCRKPQKMIVMDSDSGKVLADLPIGAGVDAVQYDDGYALASCGDGTLAVVGETSPGKFAVVQTVQTGQGARTAGLDAQRHTLYLPTAEYGPKNEKGRAQAKPGSFKVIEVSRKG